MSYPLVELGARAFNHSASDDAEREYDRLRQLARDEHSKRQKLSSQSQQAYQSGDGGRAHDLSVESKKHAAKADDYNRQASEFIFRENNSAGRVPGDTIDLHGLYVEEAEEIMRTRIRAARERGESHLHVIVGKGNHSSGHVQKIKPCVEELCRELGVAYRTEENEGRLYVDLTGSGNIPHTLPQPGQGHHGGGGGYPGQHGGQQQHHGGQQQHGGQQHHGGQQNQQQDDLEKLLPQIFKALGKCCTVM